jgi:hypothetical protein
MEPTPKNSCRGCASIHWLHQAVLCNGLQLCWRLARPAAVTEILTAAGQRVQCNQDGMPAVTSFLQAIGVAAVQACGG